MSTLTKVLVLLVSALSIFLSGVFVLQLTTSNDLQSEIKTTKGLLRATQTQSLATEDSLTKGLDALNSVNKILQNKVALLAEQHKEATVQRDLALNAKSLAEATAARATELANTLASMNSNMQNSEIELFSQLTETNNARVQAEIKNAQLNQELANTKAESEHKTREIRRLKESEKIKDDMIAELRVQLRASSAGTATPVTGQASRTQASTTGVNIRGEIIEVRENGLVELSVGASSGVREGMIFHITRGGRFLSDMVIKSVHTDRAVGELFNSARGEVVLNRDSASTSFIN